jgi:hypothetical protein
MVTLPSAGRLAFVKRSIAAYCAQTHARRELVVLLDQGPAEAKAAIQDHVAALGRDDIRIVEAPAPMTLGALRNLSRASAWGEVHCQWDDDDLHHPERIERELAALTASGAEAVCLQEVMKFFEGDRTLYWTNWRAAEPTVMPATILCRAETPVRYPEDGPTARLGEDTDLCVQLLRRGGLHPIADAPHLFVYVSHGANTWNAEFHQMLADELGLSQGLLRRREARIRECLKAFDFGPGPITVQGPNGPAFTIEG